MERHQGDKGVRKLSCWGQFVALFFGQLTGQHSLRDLVTTLDAGRKKLQQVGRGAVSRSPLADANRKRPQEIFGELFGCLYQRCLLGPVKKGTKANGSKIPQGEEWTHR